MLDNLDWKDKLTLVAAVVLILIALAVAHLNHQI